MDEKASDLPLPPSFQPDEQVFSGGRLSDRVFCIRQDNASPMTYTGTNTYVASEPESPWAYVIDPGSSDEAHRRAVAEHLAAEGKKAAAVLTTHAHFDHAEDASRLAKDLGAPLHTWIDGTLREGEFLACAEAPRLEVVHVPGHSRDSVALLYPADASCFTGDVVFKHGPTVVFYPDGNLAEYLESLNVLERMAREGRAHRFYAAHGWPFDQPTYFVEATRQHRLERLEQIRKALDSGVPANPDALADTVYASVSSDLRMATVKSIQAQLEYLSLHE